MVAALAARVTAALQSFPKSGLVQLWQALSVQRSTVCVWLRCADVVAVSRPRQPTGSHSQQVCTCCFLLLSLATLQEWQLRLAYLMLETLGALRSNDMFDIVIDYPDSAPALADLALCLQHTNMAGQFAATFKASLQQRLLHAGAATSDIIQTYINTIKAVRQLGKSGEQAALNEVGMWFPSTTRIVALGWQ